ncbi:peptidase S1 [Brevundimonas sp.]|uniref:peptidase S1 n=1 Tax=Brevundimonas sp. TaxID=1871086 RepID=UPI003A91D381
MKTIICALTLTATLALPGATLAQNPGLRANYGEISLRAGFTPDPYRVSMAAGGGIDVYTDTPLPANCVGNITAAPDFEVTYTAGSLPLAFRTVSDRDTTLVINAPDGSWWCDDDGFGDGDAEVRFNRPQSGTYDIWVGTFGGGTAPATLLITETP